MPIPSSRAQTLAAVSSEAPRLRPTGMTKITCDMSMSVDGFTAGPGQTRDLPFGRGALGPLTRWMTDEPEAHADELAALTAAKAYIMGRNMFGPDRGDWDRGWQGWWGAEPP